MATFPTLRTSAVAQYPLSRSTVFRTEILKFVDGTEQRYGNYPRAIIRWTVHLDSLDEGELALIRQFFRSQAGTTGRFTFTDPLTGTAYTNCSFDQQAATGDLKDTVRCATTLVIRTNE